VQRNIGEEILEGIRQLKRGEHGRVKVPSVTSIREKAGLSQPRFAELLGVSCVLSKNGNRVAGHRPTVVRLRDLTSRSADARWSSTGRGGAWQVLKHKAFCSLDFTRPRLGSAQPQNNRNFD
jgi:hypothetical protein